MNYNIFVDASTGDIAKKKIGVGLFCPELNISEMDKGYYCQSYYHEVQAVIFGLRFVRKNGLENVVMFSDCNALVVNLNRGLFKFSVKLYEAGYPVLAEALLNWRADVKFKWVPRNLNVVAHNVAKIAITGKEKNLWLLSELSRSYPQYQGQFSALHRKLSEEDLVST